MTQFDQDNEYRNEQSTYHNYQTMNLSQKIFDPEVEVGTSDRLYGVASGSYLKAVR